MTLVSAGVILFVMLPLLRGDWAPLERSDDEVTDVDARKQAALRGLRDAEYDYVSGKLDQEDYRILKSDLARQALEALEEEERAASLGSDGATPTVEAGKRSKGSGAKRARETARGTARGASPDPDGASLEAEIARARKGLAEGRTCPACGHLNVKKSLFCTSCGGALGEVATTGAKPASG